LFYLFTFAINLWHRKFVTTDVTAVFINNQHGIHRRRQDFYKHFICMRKTRYFKHQKYQNLWMSNKVRGDLNAICLHFCHIC